MSLENVRLLSEGLGLCSKDPQGTGPLTRFLGFAQTHPRRKAGKGCTCPFSAA